MTILVLTGFRTAVFNAVPESLKVAIVVGIGFFIAFIGLVNAGIIRRMPDAAGTTVPVSFGVSGHLLGWPPRLPFRPVPHHCAVHPQREGCQPLWRARLTAALSIILEKVSPPAARLSPHRLVPERPRLGLQHQQAPNFSLFGSADLFPVPSAPSAAWQRVLLIFTILISAFFDAMGHLPSVSQPKQAPSRTARSRTSTRSCSWTPSAP